MTAVASATVVSGEKAYAVRQALDYTSTLRAFVVCAIGGLIILGLILLLVSPLFGGVS
jgi:hypothetical protein